MKYSQLKTILTKTNSNDYRSLSNLYKEKNKARICLAVYESKGFSFKSYYFLHLEMDYAGKILEIKDDYQKDLKKISKYKKLIGKKLDFNSFKWDYQKIVHNRPVGVESSTTVGTIDDKGKFVLYNSKNVDKINFPRKYRTNGDKLADYGGYESSQEFLNFYKEYKNQVKSFSIYNDGITYYRVGFKIQGFDVSMELQQFFNYSLKVKLYHPKKGCLVLKDEEVTNFSQVLKEFKTGNLSNETIVKMITEGYGVSYCNFVSLDPQRIQAEVKFNGYDKRPKGKYQFVFDLKNKQVVCLNGQKSIKFIPKQVQKYQEALSLF